MTVNRSRVVVLDRDGVINEDSADFIKSAAEWREIPGSIDAIARLHKAGFRIAVATNQSGIGRGLISEDALAEIHKKMLDRVAAAGGNIDRIIYCPHLPDDQCDCRKPLPGMLYEVAEHLGCGLQNMIVVGDAARDLEAARAAGCRAILVRTGKGQATEKTFSPAAKAEVYDDLAQAANKLLAEGGDTQ